ncbi:MAG: hypothetical protein NTX61_08790 [Bacteroidetes bacterium]|nr:hypothetical protein [Bacteroidota bacterium]
MNQLNAFDNKWKTVVANSIGSLNKVYIEQRTTEIIGHRQLLQKCAVQQFNPGALPDPMPYPAYSMEMKNKIVTARLHNNSITFTLPAALPLPIPNPGLLMDFNNGMVTATFNGKSIKSVPVNAVPTTKLPNITSIQTMTTDPSYLKDLKSSQSSAALGAFSVYDNNYIIIYGMNFGEADNNCGVWIGYEILRKEEISNEPPKHYDFELIPYGGTWKKSWFNDFIVAFLPGFPRSIQGNLGVQRTITLWKGGQDSFKITREIYLKHSEPKIASIQYAPDETPLYDKAKFWIYGSGFEGTQGKNTEIYIESTSVNNYFQVSKKQSPVTVIKWSDNLIEAQAPDFNLDDPVDAQLVIDNKVTPKATLSVKIGPLMAYIWISGEKFANLQRPDPADEAHRENKTVSGSSLNVLAVSHYPGCGTSVTSGNNTDDWYFKSFPEKPGELMPPHFKYCQLFYFPMRPEAPSDGWEDYLGYTFDLTLNLPFYLTKKFFETIFHFFDPGMGKYCLELRTAPTPSDPATQIHFNNACTGDYSGYPNKYLIAFKLYGPVKYMWQLEKNPDDIKKWVDDYTNSISK